MPYTSYHAADGMIALAVGNDAQFARCAAVLGHPEWGDDPRFKRNRDRVAHRDIVDGMTDAAFKRDRVDAWLAKLNAAGVPCGRINTVGEALREPHTAARDMIETVTHAKTGPMTMLGIPMKFSGTPGAVQCAPPLLGQHTDEILSQRLGLDAQAIARLRPTR